MTSTAARNRAERRPFTITKFGRHKDGYFHARVTINGETIYTHCQSGSWMIPGHIGDRPVLKELVSMEIKKELQSKVRTVLKAEQPKKPATVTGSSDANNDVTGDTHEQEDQ